jgi:hypothetical protein
MICDEIQTGTGKTGKWAAYQYSLVRVDIISLVQGIMSGILIRAIITCKEFEFARDEHGSNSVVKPLICVVGNVALDVLKVLIRKDGCFILFLFGQNSRVRCLNSVIHLREESFDNCRILPRAGTVNQRCWRRKCRSYSLANY